MSLKVTVFFFIFLIAFTGIILLILYEIYKTKWDAYDLFISLRDDILKNRKKIKENKEKINDIENKISGGDEDESISK